MEHYFDDLTGQDHETYSKSELRNAAGAAYFLGAFVGAVGGVAMYAFYLWFNYGVDSLY